jgi:DNA modification methylase
MVKQEGEDVKNPLTQTWHLLTGDVRERLTELPDASVQCCVTSPPYWGLRDYGIDGQLGLEPTPDAYVASMVAVFRLVRRVLRGDGTLWLNLGDSYAAGKQGRDDNDPVTRAAMDAHGHGGGVKLQSKGNTGKARKPPDGLKPKDLVGIPWRLAFALQADGWYLRSDIIWNKPNPMPESVTDRPTKSHEYVFLLTKSAKYFYDAEAVREKATALPQQRLTAVKNQPSAEARARVGGQNPTCQGGTGTDRNARSVWTITTQPYPDAHFATFPEALPERCITAGTSERGACPLCGAGWGRVVEKGSRMPEPEHRHPPKRLEPGQAGNVGAGNMGFRASKASGKEMSAWKADHPDTTTGWHPSCECPAADPVPQRVLDPFAGSGTTGQVAIRLGRSFLGIELNPEYAGLARTRIGGAAPLFAQEIA